MLLHDHCPRGTSSVCVSHQKQWQHCLMTVGFGDRASSVTVTGAFFTTFFESMVTIFRLTGGFSTMPQQSSKTDLSSQSRYGKQSDGSKTRLKRTKAQWNDRWAFTVGHCKITTMTLVPWEDESKGLECPHL